MLKVFADIKNALPNANESEKQDFQISVYGFNSLGKVSYKSELSGVESKLPKLSAHSKKTGGVVIAGAITDNYGILKKSAVISDRGKLLGISDCVLGFDGSAYQGGGSYKVYQTSACKIGLIIAEDIKNFEAVKSMSLCDADLIVMISPEDEKNQHNFLVRAYAYLFGVATLLVTKNSVIASDSQGEIVGKSVEAKSNLMIPVKRQYVLTKIKRRGGKD